MSFYNLVFNNEPYTIKILNSLGEIIYEKTESTQNFKLETQNLKNGIYFVTLSNKDFSETQKIIIQK